MRNKNNKDDKQFKNDAIQDENQLESSFDSKENITSVKNKQKQEEIRRKNEELIQKITKLNEEKVLALKQRNKQRFEILIIIAIFMLILFVITFGIFLFLNQVPNISEDYIRVSFSKINKEVFFEESVTGEKIPKIISPGDKFNLIVATKNSNNPNGDSSDEIWGNIYLRYKIVLVVDGVEHADFIEIEPEVNSWHRYNKEQENNFTFNGKPIVSKDDGYYYYKGILGKNQSVTLFDNIKFSGKNITEAVGGKNAELVITIEALDAIENSITNRIYWVDAPQAWVNYMTK